MNSKAKTMSDEFVYQMKRVVSFIPNGLELQYSLMLRAKSWSSGKRENSKRLQQTVLLAGEGVGIKQRGWV